jgi:hypothetical protein
MDYLSNKDYFINENDTNILKKSVNFSIMHFNSDN